ncbi:MAG: hypothetical protein H0T62_03020 [Parachlamydiaceae bacterium]|nr:hypothetical protein [Parachlamydiaceae bacterium]
MHCNYLGPSGGASLAEAFKDSKYLTHLRIDNNNIGKRGEAISKNLQGLTHLNICANNIKSAGAIQIVNNLTNLETLEHRILPSTLSGFVLRGFCALQRD